MLLARTAAVDVAAVDDDRKFTLQNFVKAARCETAHARRTPSIELVKTVLH